MEADFSKKVIFKLKEYFDVKAECWSKCGKYRIDFVLTEKSNSFDKRHFGIEFKNFDKKQGHGIGEHILQSIRYSLSEFKVDENVYKRIPIFICPPISYNYLMLPVHESKKVELSIYGRMAEYFHDRHDKNMTHHTVNGLLGSLNIGEVRTMLIRKNQHLYFSFSNQVIWSNFPTWNNGYDATVIQGTDKNKYDLLIKKVQSFSI